METNCERSAGEFNDHEDQSYLPAVRQLTGPVLNTDIDNAKSHIYTDMMFD